MDPTDEMPADRANRIADGVESIKRNVSRLREVQQVSRSEYKAEDRQDLRDATERKFEKVTEAVLDVAEEILKQEQVSVPPRRKGKITAIERTGMIEPDLAELLQESVEFRDVLSHTYGPIVNDDIVYDAVQNSLERYVEFVGAVDEYFESRTSDE